MKKYLIALLLVSVFSLNIFITAVPKVNFAGYKKCVINCLEKEINCYKKCKSKKSCWGRCLQAKGKCGFGCAKSAGLMKYIQLRKPAKKTRRR